MNINKFYRPLIGIQNSVMAFTEPFGDPALSEIYKRTGEGFHFPVQDGNPCIDEYCRMLSSENYDFLVQQTMPEEQNQLEFIERISQEDIKYILGNEFGSINRICTHNTNRADVSSKAVSLAAENSNFMGILYDESEHQQLHPEIYDAKHGDIAYQWADAKGKTLDEIENAVTEAVKEVVTHYTNTPCYSEHVFPVMYHAFARGGMNLVPKVLKEEFQSLQLASALGAAVQYKRDMGICVDLWGSDVGEWFTRVWGFPGHSPLEFENALRMAWHFSPAFMFVENMDPLFLYSKQKGFNKTEFGEIYAKFIHEYVPMNPLPYRFNQAQADIALVRSDDTLISDKGGFFNYSMYGSRELTYDFTHTSVFKAWRFLSHNTLPDNGLTWFLPQFDFPKGRFPVTTESIKSLPKISGEKVDGWENKHGLFYPLNNVLVFDHFASYEVLYTAKLIVVAGSRMSQRCMEDILKCVYEGATLLSVSWLMPEQYRENMSYGHGQIIITEDFSEKSDYLLGDRNIWSQRFGQYEVQITNPTGDGISLNISVNKS